MTTKEIIGGIVSENTDKVWRSVREIISLGQNRKKILPLTEHLPEIIEKTKDLEPGSGFASMQRFVDFAIRTLEFHRDNSNVCPCILYLEHGVDPQRESEKGYIEIIESKFIKEECFYRCLAECTKCGQKFEVIERDNQFHTPQQYWKALQ